MMPHFFKKGLFIFLTILFVGLIIWSFLGMSRREGFGSATTQKNNNLYSASVSFDNNIYSIIVTNAKNVPIAAFYTNPVTQATLSNIATVTFESKSNEDLWKTATATIAIDTSKNTYTVTCTLSDKSKMTFVGPYTDTIAADAKKAADEKAADEKAAAAKKAADAKTDADYKKASSNYENYNHFNGSSYPTMFYGPGGGTAQIMNAAGTYTLVLTDSNGKTTTYSTQATNSNANQGNGNINTITQTTYYGPDGTTATVTSGGNGQYIVKVANTNGNTTVYYPTQTGQTGQTPGPGQTPTPDNWKSWANWFNNSSDQNNNDDKYSSSLPKGVPRSLIPPGQEDLYILKSEVVPPVCPMCPTANCPKSNSTCQPCPACARCPEPAFDCKKIPNYNSKSNGLIPEAILPNSYSTFGM
jgi:hypothetical protein